MTTYFYQQTLPERKTYFSGNHKFHHSGYSTFLRNIYFKSLISQSIFNVTYLQQNVLENFCLHRTGLQI